MMVDEERILKELLETVIDNEGIKNPDVKIKPISTGGANYTSTLHLITIKGANNVSLELFAKVACVGENFRQLMQADRLYGTERFVYQDLVKIYEDLQTQNEIPENERLLFPKFYACSDKYLEETVILENLVAKGYALYDRAKPVTWEFGSKAIGELAKLHALSHAFAENDPEKFAEVTAERQFMFSDTGDDMKKMWELSTTNALQLIPEKLKPRLQNFFEKESETDFFTKYYKSPRSPVLVHGDYRCSNLLYKRKNGKLESLVPVDYQTVHSGSPLIDLLYFIFCGTDGEFRKLHYKRLINHYYTTFAGFLTKLGLNPKELYPRQHFDEDLKNALPFGLITGVFTLPIVLVEAEDIPKLNNMSDLAVKSSDMYKRRLNEIIRDFMQWGIV